MKGYGGAGESITIDVGMCRDLKQLSKQQGCTLFMTLLAGYLSFLHRVTAQDDVVIGFPVSGRSAPGSEHLVAYCSHLAPIRSSLVGDPTFAEFLAAFRPMLLEVYEHQEYPFGKLLERLKIPTDPGRTPIVNVTFNMERSISLPKLHGLTSELLSPPISSAEFDLHLNVTEVDDKLLIDLVYATDLFDAATVRRMLEQYRTLLAAVVSAPNQPISTIPLLTAAERQLLVEWNDTRKHYQQDLCLHDWFERQVKKTPSAIALTFEDECLTYRQLDERANLLANYLRGLGVGPEAPVGVCMERSLRLWSA